MTDQTHLGGAYETGDANTIMPDIWGYLIVKYGVRSVLDIGCGFGHSCSYFGSMCQPISWLGIDGWKEAIDRTVAKGCVRLHDFTTGPCELNDTFDLAWSSEFVEHVDEVYQANYMAAFQKCRRACITHSVPGQAGFHHVNCRDDAYWIAVFANYGFAFDAAETALMRRTDCYGAVWGRCTLMLFHRLAL